MLTHLHVQQMQNTFAHTFSSHLHPLQTHLYLLQYLLLFTIVSKSNHIFASIFAYPVNVPQEAFWRDALQTTKQKQSSVAYKLRDVEGNV